MNINSQGYNLPIPTAVNLQTDSLRRDNQQREIITKPEASNQSAAEKGVASDKERGRTPAQNNEQVDFASLRKQAELANDVIGDNSERSAQDSPQDNDKEDNEQSSNSKGELTEEQGSQEGSEKSKEALFAEQQEVKSLKLRDQEVRSHELAHAAVGGAYTGAPNYSFEVGPDGNKYAIGGEVSVDLAPVDGNPSATIAKMQKVHAAALAPANPSIQDTRVAASAAKLIAQAQSELSAISLEDPNAKQDFVGLIRPNDVLSQEGQSANDASNEFDQFIGQTLSAQEQVAPSRSLEVDERAGRINQFYANINQAYEKPASYQFELTA
ncbi:hypothetical protein FGD67_12310 [Colwellia sp. M166]|uniref:putative metalloprotease CJM1_0395 family protein n=1 Tax=Colwellia sp. M166 TaxID=2583805 RepID=UPI00211E0985|nr:putative metalloprotease CJM1_0395 family protein [Colwellia sp. M166]UUO23918.1 hypothetical protein FGD67_12310 [Colwellia sp. M166]|tara:strand:- start:5481 stop:6458 length:978 start_codon:yes stop_codon:yes gene_type:complete